MYFTVELPLPPTINHAYSNVPGRGRVSTKAKKDWSRQVFPLLPPTPIKKEAVGYGVRVYITIRLSSWRSDIDNYTKLLVDAVLPTLGLDDRYIVKLVVEREAVPKEAEGARVEVEAYARV